MGWDSSIPANDSLLINFPALCRADWDAIALGTDADLLITNAKCAAGMALADTKLAQITTAAKVSGAAITLLANVPSGAGVLPDVNSNNKLKADSLDTTPQYLDSLVNTDMFEISASDLLELKDDGIEAEKLEGGNAAPGNYKFYGTSSDGSAFAFRALTEAMITDLVHDATKIRGATVDVPAAGDDGQFMKYNHSGPTISFEEPDYPTSPSAVADTETGGATITGSGSQEVCSVAKTIVSGNTVILTFGGYAVIASADADLTWTLKQGSTVVQTVVAKPNYTGKKAASMTAVITGLSGAITFSVYGSMGIGKTAVAYGNLTVLEIGGN